MSEENSKLIVQKENNSEPNKLNDMTEENQSATKTIPAKLTENIMNEIDTTSENIRNKINTIQNTSITTSPKGHSPWNICLIVISILAIISLVISLITYFSLKKAEKLYEEQTATLLDVYRKKLDAQAETVNAEKTSK